MLSPKIADSDCQGIFIPALSAGGQRAPIHIAQAQGEDSSGDFPACGFLEEILPSVLMELEGILLHADESEWHPAE